MAVRGMRSEIAVVEQVNVGDTLYAGAIAGSVGGVLFMIFAMGMAVLNGMDILSPLRLVGGTFIGAGALEGGAGVILYGALLHTATAAAWGILFAALLPREAPLSAALIAGLVYGLLVMLVMLYAVLPVANPTMRESVDGTTAFSMEHLIYGGTLVLVPALRRRFTEAKS